MDRTGNQHKSPYLKFITMIGTSMLLMYLLTYLNSSDILGHAWFSETRLFMTMIMGGSMTLVMFAFMKGNYTNSTKNIFIVLGAITMFVVALVLVRSQVTVDDVDYMEGMIPHHSIAILTSENAIIKDQRVRQLADDIIEAQRREIKEMEWLIGDIRTNGIAFTAEEVEARPVPEFSAAPD